LYYKCYCIKFDVSFYLCEKGVEPHRVPSGEARKLGYLGQAMMMGLGLGEASAMDLMTMELLLYGQDENKWSWTHSLTIHFNNRSLWMKFHFL
jgi:hypothetical protein